MHKLKKVECYEQYTFDVSSKMSKICSMKAHINSSWYWVSQVTKQCPHFTLLARGKKLSLRLLFPRACTAQIASPLNALGRPLLLGICFKQPKFFFFFFFWGTLFFILEPKLQPQARHRLPSLSLLAPRNPRLSIRLQKHSVYSPLLHKFCFPSIFWDISSDRVISSTNS